ncbi:MAG: hypothetical protein LBJ69_01575 [Holosporales bacterium]|nr:hypothetical protein [Holosporales bacterium]
MKKLLTLTLTLGLIACEAWSSRERERALVGDKQATLFGTLRATLKAINDTQTALTDQNTELLSQLNTSLTAATQNITAILLGSSGEEEDADIGLVGKVEEIDRIVSDEGSGLPKIRGLLEDGTYGLEAIKAAITDKADGLPAVLDLLNHADHGLAKIKEAIGRIEGTGDVGGDDGDAEEQGTTGSGGEWTVYPAQINAWADRIINTLPQPENMRWAAPILTAFMTGRMRSGALSISSYAPDGGWRTHHREEPEHSGDYNTCMIRYLYKDGTKDCGWRYFATPNLQCHVAFTGSTQTTEGYAYYDGSQHRANGDALASLQTMIASLNESINNHNPQELLVVTSCTQGAGRANWPELVSVRITEPPEIYLIPRISSLWAEWLPWISQYALTGQNAPYSYPGDSCTSTAADYILWRPDIPPAYDLQGSDQFPLLHPLYIEAPEPPVVPAPGGDSEGEVA